MYSQITIHYDCKFSKFQTRLSCLSLNIAKGVALVLALLVVLRVLGHPIATALKASVEFAEAAFCGLQQLLN